MARLKDPKGHIKRSTSNLAKIVMWITFLLVKLQHDADNFRGVITFTRCCHMLSFDHDIV